MSQVKLAPQPVLAEVLVPLGGGGFNPGDADLAALTRLMLVAMVSLGASPKASLLPAAAHLKFLTPHARPLAGVPEDGG